MPRQQLIPTDSPLLVDERKNPIAHSREFKNIIEDCFGGAIFPPGVASFEREVAPLYISQRNWNVDEDFESHDDEFKYEQYLDRHFWDKTESRRLIFLVGGVGTGKSTFIDFYLRCYCPTLSPNRTGFREKLPITINAKGKTKEEDLVTYFYRQAAYSIRERCRQLNYELTLPGTHIDPDINPEAWTVSVLRHLCNGIKSQAAHLSVPFKYIVVTIDNLDQSPLDVQRRAIALVRDWLDPAFGIVPWRVYIPMWPQTLSKLLNAMGQPFTKDEYTVVPLGTVPYVDVIDNRQQAAVGRILRSGVISVSAHGEKDGDIVTEGTIDNRRARSFVQDTHQFCERLIGPFIESISNFDLRRELQIWENILSSRVTFQSWRDFVRRLKWQYTVNRLPHDLVDAAVTGKCVQYNSVKSRLDNPFECGENNLLIGLHTLCVFRHANANEIPKDNLRRILYSIGHNELEVEATLGRLFEANTYHEIAGDNNTVNMVIHPAPVEAYFELAFHPGFLENAALVTPVDQEWLRSMTVTTLLETGDFVPRVRSTLAFIAQIRDDEIAFWNRVKIRLEHGSKEEKRRELDLIERVDSPVLWVLAAQRYKERLDALRSKQQPVGVNVPWDEFIDKNDLFDFKQASVDSKWTFR